MKVKVVVQLKKAVLDPQGQAIFRSLKKMGHEELVDVRQGKYFELEFESNDRMTVRQITEEIAQTILSNPLIERFQIVEVS